MATTTQAPTQTAVGTITGVGEANQGGFANIKLEMASGDLWLSTKSPGLIAVARNKRGDYVAVDYVTQESKNISTKTGRPFINHYIQAIREPAAEELPTSQYSDDDIPFGAPTPVGMRRVVERAERGEPTSPEVTMQQEMEALRPSTVGMWQDEVPSSGNSSPTSSRDRQIHRQTAGKVIAAFAPFDMDITTEAGWFAFTTLCDKFVEYVERD